MTTVYNWFGQTVPVHRFFIGPRKKLSQTSYYAYDRLVLRINPEFMNGWYPKRWTFPPFVEFRSTFLLIYVWYLTKQLEHVCDRFA